MKLKSKSLLMWAAIFTAVLVVVMPANADVIEDWLARYDGGNNYYDVAEALAIDTSGNVYVTGWSDGYETYYDYATIKYDADGSQEWVARYDSGDQDDDRAFAIVVDMDDNAYVTGESWSDTTGYDYATIKYDKNGNRKWVVRYNGPGNSYDRAQAIAVDPSGNVYVTGRSRGSTSSFDYATIKYDKKGIQQWVARYNGPGNSGDYAMAIAIDGYYVYVTGWSYSSNSDYATIKYTASNGNQQWVARYNAGSSDIAEAIAVDLSGNVYVTGWSYGSGGSFPNYDYATIKYNANGVQQWLSRYNGIGNGEDRAYGLVVDLSGNAYVTGYSKNTSRYDYDYVTIRYAASGGSQDWLARYDGPANSYDGASSIAIDRFGNIYVTGRSAGSTGIDYATLSYDGSNGTQRWVARYEGPDNGDDSAWDIAVGPGAFQYVYVTGQSYSSATYVDYCTVKYFPSVKPQ